MRKGRDLTPRAEPFRGSRGACAILTVLVILGGLSPVLAGRAWGQEAGAVGQEGSAELKKQAAAGNAKAQYQLARLLETGSQDEPADLKQALALYCRAARKGEGAAAYRMSRLYMFGRGVPIDGHMSIAWLRVAAGLGHPDAERLLSLLPPREARIPAACGLGILPPVRYRPPPPAILAMVHRLAPDFGLDPGLVAAVVEVESAWRADAVSPKDAAGLMQLMPETALRFGVTDVFNPEENLKGGMRYLRWLMSYFRGDVPLVIAAYNAGEGAVERHGGLPPFAETVDYVQKVQRRYPRLIHAFDATVSRPSSLVAVRTGGRGRP